MHKPSIVSAGIFVIMGILAIAHFVVYQAIVTMLSIITPHSFILAYPANIFLGTIFTILAFSFVSAIFISFAYNTLLNRWWYRFSAIWTGFLLYLFAASFLYGILCLFCVDVFPNILSVTQLAYIGLLCMLIAILTTVYALFHANKIVYTHVDIDQSDIAKLWKDKRVVWISDVHLGHVRGIQFAQKIVDKIKALGLKSADIVCIGGDLFDGVKVDAEKIIEPLQALTHICQVYFIMGNHEEIVMHDAAKYLHAVESLGIHVLEDTMIDLDGVQVIGVDHGHVDTAEKLKNVLKTTGFDRNKPSVLFKHEPRDVSVAARAGITFQISGHTHHGQIFPVNFLTKAMFKGFDYGLKKCAGMLVYTSSGIGTWGPPIRIGTRSEIVIFNFK